MLSILYSAPSFLIGIQFYEQLRMYCNSFKVHLCNVLFWGMYSKTLWQHINFLVGTNTHLLCGKSCFSRIIGSVIMKRNKSLFHSLLPSYPSSKKKKQDAEREWWGRTRQPCTSLQWQHPGQSSRAVVFPRGEEITSRSICPFYLFNHVKVSCRFILPLKPFLKLKGWCKFSYS